MRIRSLLPRSLYGRAALILIVPIVTIQLVVSVIFIQRHFERVTEQMTQSVAAELSLIMAEVAAAGSQDAARARLASLARELDIKIYLPARDAAPAANKTALIDLAGRVMISSLQKELTGLGPIDLTREGRDVALFLPGTWGDMQVMVARDRMTASNPHQLLVLMLLTSLLMTVIAFIFLKNQLRPIARMAFAAQEFGKGRIVPFAPRGATEVRAAGHAFLDMRRRIERSIEQRTLLLSGVSHDLRTPLTRMRLGLSLLPEDEETTALLGDVAEMERLVDEFLAFARGDATEEAEIVDPADLARHVVGNAERAGQAVRLMDIRGTGTARLRPQAVTRALENLIGNAVRHGTAAELRLMMTRDTLRFIVEDNGPGIPPEAREAAMTPFQRLDQARNPNRGGGVGLGLAIAADIARSHGGRLRLGHSDHLGGLRAELVIAR